MQQCRTTTSTLFLKRRLSGESPQIQVVTIFPPTTWICWKFDAWKKWQKVFPIPGGCENGDLYPMVQSFKKNTFNKQKTSCRSQKKHGTSKTSKNTPLTDHCSGLLLLQENYNTPRYRTSQAIPRSPTMKGIPWNSLLVKVARGVFQFGVLVHNLSFRTTLWFWRILRVQPIVPHL